MGIARSWSRRVCAAPVLVWLAVTAAPPAAAQTFEEAFAAYERGDYATAFRGFRSYAEQGDADAQDILGLMYLKGEGVPQDYAEAARWARRAAEQGHADAQNRLGVMYYDGKGVSVDHAAAAMWLRRAAEQGNAYAQWSLGSMHEEGRGVRRDYVLAHKWYNLAAARFLASKQGLRRLVAQKRDWVALKLTPNEIALAQRIAREWRPREETAAPSREPLEEDRDMVAKAQRELAQLGYDPGPVDGTMGPRTRAAIRAFERNRGLPATGVLTDDLAFYIAAAAIAVATETASPLPSLE